MCSSRLRYRVLRSTRCLANALANGPKPLSRTDNSQQRDKFRRSVKQQQRPLLSGLQIVFSTNSCCTCKSACAHIEMCALSANGLSFDAAVSNRGSLSFHHQAVGEVFGSVSQNALTQHTNRRTTNHAQFSTAIGVCRKRAEALLSTTRAVAPRRHPMLIYIKALSLSASIFVLSSLGGTTHANNVFPKIASNKSMSLQSSMRDATSAHCHETT